MKYPAFCALTLACLLGFAGCTSTSHSGTADIEKGGEASVEVGSVQQAPNPEPLPANEAAVKAKLDQAAQKLASMANRTVVPSQSKPKVQKKGNQYVKTYIAVDFPSVSTSMRRGQSSSVPYIGIIEYTEVGYECRGASKKAALASTDCQAYTSRKVKEMISYDGKKWVY